MFKAALLSTAAILFAAPAMAQLVDPTAFHVTSPSATNTDPVLLNEGHTFTVNDNDLPGGDTIVSPLEIFLLEPTTQAAPIVTSALFAGLTPSDAFTITAQPQWNTGAQNSFYKDYLACGGGCDGSVNATNVNAAEASIGLVGGTFNVFEVNVEMNKGNGFTAAGQFETLLGNFALGTIVAPFATNGGNKVYDTSWTNAGFVNHTTGSTPEASSWVMMLVGFMLIGGLAWRKSENRLRSLV